MIDNKSFIIFFLSILIIGNFSIVNGLVPVTYACCHNYTYDDGVQIDNFEYRSPFTGVQIDNLETLNNWTKGGTGGSVEIDSINFVEGQRGLKLIAKNGNRVTIDKVINHNFSNSKNFQFWIYVHDVNTFRQVNLYFTSTGTAWSQYFYKGIYSGFKNGWNRIIIDKNIFINFYGSESWNNTMNRVRIAVYPITGMNTNATVDDLRYDIDNDWAGSFQESDMINFKEGQQGLKLTATNGSSVYSDLAVNKNFSDINNFAIWVYINDANKLSSIGIYLSSDPWNKYFYDSVKKVRTGWNRFVFNKHSFKNYFNENWNNNMVTLRLRINPGTGQDLNVTFDDLRNNITGKRAKIMIEFDDGIYNVYSNAYSILRSNNQSGITFVVTHYVDLATGGQTSTYMNLSNLRALQSSGWDISSHTVNHTDLSESDDSTQISEINGSYDWLVANKFQKSAGFIAYPYGAMDDTVIDKVEKRYIFGRAAGSNFEGAQQHFSPDERSIRYIQRIIEVYNYSTVQWVKDNINDSINAKLLGILTFHGIVDYNPNTYQYLKSNFQVISDYLKSRNNDIDVITYSDYVITNIKDFTPVINKTTRIFTNGSSVLITNNKYDEYMPNMTIKASFDFIDINITTYDEISGLIKFNESTINRSIMASYDIGDRIPNHIYSVKIYWPNGTKYQDFNVLANNTGHINYNSEEFEYSRYQEIKYEGVLDTAFTVTLPIGYTFLRFNASSPTIVNLYPDGQSSSQPMFNITNSGNIIQNYAFYINGTVANVTTYADLDNVHSNGRKEINTTPSVIVPSLNPGSSQNLWIIMDANKALVTNTNKTLMINSS